MSIIVQLMLLFLIVCAIAVCLTRDLLTSVVIYMAYSMIMSVVCLNGQSEGTNDHGQRKNQGNNLD